MIQHDLLRIALRFISRLYPFIRGRGKLVNSRLWKQSMSQLENVVCTTITGGSLLFIYSRDFIGRMVYFFEDLDPKVTWVCQRILRPGDIMIDVGANVGLISIIAARLVGKTGTIHSFEPQPSLLDLFQQSIKANLYNQIILHPVGLSDRNGKMSLKVPKNNYGKGSLSRDYPAAETIEIPIFKLSEYMKKYQLESIRLMKIDVEGHETQVIKGALELFKKVTPEVIIFEFNEKNKKLLWKNDIIQILHSIGYEFYEIPNAIFKIKLNRIYKDDNQQIKGNDIVALYKSNNLADLYSKLSI